MQRCSGEEEPLEWRLGVGFSGANTTLLFGRVKSELRELGAAAVLERKLSSRITLSVSAGAVYAGTLQLPDFGGIIFDVRGPVLGVGISGLVVEQSGWVPFVMLGGEIAGSALFSQQGPVIPLDARASVTAGYSFRGWLTPYLVARAFGGPVFYSSFTGTDAYHYQLGLGVSLALPSHWDVLLEAVPLGEQRAVLGVGRSF